MADDGPYDADNSDANMPDEYVHPDERPSRPPADSCPFCDDGRLYTTLEAGTVRGPHRNPTLVHETSCGSCGAHRRVEIRLDEITGSIFGGPEWPPSRLIGSLEPEGQE